MLATGDDFQDTHKKLEDMMCKERGVENWSKTHSSPLEYSKLALINFAHRRNTTKSPALQLPHKTIEPSDNTKYLGVIVDRNLTWKAQQSYAVEKGTKWAAQIRRLTQPSWGITPKYAKCLFISIALPRVLYAVDVWCSPSDGTRKGPIAIGSVKTSNQITSVQRAGTLCHDPAPIFHFSPPPQVTTITPSPPATQPARAQQAPVRRQSPASIPLPPSPPPMDICPPSPPRPTLAHFMP